MTKDQNHENDVPHQNTETKNVILKKVVPIKKIIISSFKNLSKYLIENTHTNVCESSVCSSPFLPLQILISLKKPKMMGVKLLFLRKFKKGVIF